MKIINNIVFGKKLENKKLTKAQSNLEAARYLQFCIDYALEHKIPITHAPGLYYLIDNVRVKKAYEKKNELEMQKEMKKQMLPYEKQASNVFTFLNYLEKEALSKSKKITLTLSYEELDFLKMQVRESTKAVEELKQNLKWHNMIKKIVYGLLVKQNKYFLEELSK